MGFNPGAGGVVHAIVTQSDGKIIVGGDYSDVLIGSTLYTRNNIALFNANDSLDLTFNPGADGIIYSICNQLVGKILIGGSFTSIAGQNRNNLAKLNNDGTLDMGYNPNPDGSVLALSLKIDGKHLVGGTFNGISNYLRNYIGRITPDEPAYQELTIDFEGKTITWYRMGSSPEIWDVIFEQSLDGINYTPFWGGTRITKVGNWKIRIYQRIRIYLSERADLTKLVETMVLHPSLKLSKIFFWKKKLKKTI